MSFDEAAACFSLGVGATIMLIAGLKSDFKANGEEVEFDALVIAVALGAAVYGAPLWCLIVGIRWMIHEL